MRRIFPHQFNTGTIRFRLLSSFVLMVLFTAIGIIGGTLWFGIQNGKTQAANQMASIAQLKSLQIQTWKNQVKSELDFALSEEYAFYRISTLLKIDRTDRYSDIFSGSIRARLNLLLQKTEQVQEFFILNPDGLVLLSTNREREDTDYQQSHFFQGGLSAPTLDIGVSEEQPIETAIVSVPILDSEGNPIGVMAGCVKIDSLSNLLLDHAGIGDSAKSFLLTPENKILTPQPGLLLVEKLGDQIPQSLNASQESAPASGYTDYRTASGVQVLGVSQWVPDLQMVILLQQDLPEILSATQKTLFINILIAMLAIIVTLFTSLLLIQRIVRPIDNLVQTSSKIAAGDLSQMARIERADEIGSLATSFNVMTAQLGELINGLEEKVENRTQALQQRALQMETILRVSQDIRSILSIEQLLSQITQVIQQAFNYANVQVYLLNEEKSRLHLQATSTDRILAPTDIAVDDNSYIGKAILTQKPTRVVFSQKGMTGDSEALNGDSRSALAVPLRFGENLIGIMVIFSLQETDFMQDDVLVIRSMADQIAVAIENARRYKQSQQLAVLEERNRLARELHDSVTQSLYSLGLLIESWKMMIKSGSSAGFENFLDHCQEINQQSLKEMRLLIYELRPPELEKLGLWGAIIHRLEAIEKRLGIETQLDVQEFFDIPADMEENIYRVVLEALNNSLKHAEAKSVTIRFEQTEQAIIVEVSDDGKGFDLHQVNRTGKMGIVSMEERASQLNASLEIDSRNGEGTRVKLVVPLISESHQPAAKGAVKE